VLSIPFKAALVWLTPNLSGKEMRHVESSHYRSLQLIIEDYRQRVNREWVTTSIRQMPPEAWGKFAMQIWVNIKFLFRIHPQYLLTNTQRSIYHASKTVTGRYSTRNWIGLTIGQIKTELTNKSLNNDQMHKRESSRWHSVLNSVCSYLHVFFTSC